MTSIVNFEERLKGTSSLTNEFFNSLNRMHDAKLTGALKGDEFSKLLILENKFFASLVKQGIKTEGDVEDYEIDMPTGKYPIGNFPHENITLARDTVKQTNTAALFDAEMKSNYSKGLKRAS